MTANRSPFCWRALELDWPGRRARLAHCAWAGVRRDAAALRRAVTQAFAASRPAWRAGVADASHMTAFVRARAAMYPEAAHLERLLTSNEPAALQRPRVRAYG